LGLLYLLYLNIRMIFVLPILVVSDHKVSEAITLSRKLTKKHFFKFLLQLLVFTLIGTVALFIGISLLTQITYLILNVKPSMFELGFSIYFLLYSLCKTICLQFSSLYLKGK